MVEFDINPLVRYQIATTSHIKKKLDEVSEKNKTNRSHFLANYLDEIDFSSYSILDKRAKLILPLDQDNLEKLIIFTSRNGQSLQDYINNIIRAYLE